MADAGFPVYALFLLVKIPIILFMTPKNLLLVKFCAFVFALGRGFGSESSISFYLVDSSVTGMDYISPESGILFSSY